MHEHEELTDRQRRELEYHREHARQHRDILDSPFSWEVLRNPARRWWNAYWAMYAYLLTADVKDKRVLVVGCGFGDDALRLAKLGAKVSAFDLSPDSLRIAESLAKRENLDIDFAEMPAERMGYPDGMFDCVVARDIFHHVDIPATMAEIVRVAKPGAMLVVNEIYSHSLTEKIRHSAFVEKVLYPRMRRMIYGSDSPYITADERKLNEVDVSEIERHLQAREFGKYFNFLVTRLVPDRFESLCKLDRIALALLGPVAPYLAGRILLAARISGSKLDA